MRSFACVAIVLELSGLAVGCDSNHTETGYTPRKLGMTGTQLRALYAPAFTPEAHAAELDRTPDIANRRY